MDSNLVNVILETKHGEFMFYYFMIMERKSEYLEDECDASKSPKTFLLNVFQFVSINK